MERRAQEIDWTEWKPRKSARLEFQGLASEIMAIALMFHCVIFDHKNLIAGNLSVFIIPAYDYAISQYVFL
jgi:hypothetical protein